MALILESAQTMALGHFNPHIITPAWLVRHKLAKDGEVKLRILPMPQGGAFQFKDVQWQVDFQSLIVESSKENCGKLVVEVLRKLSHTPVRAIGNNFHYGGTIESWGESPLPRLGNTGWDALSNLGKVDQLRWTGVVVQGSVRIEITVAQSESGFAVLFNFHRDVKSPKDAQQAAGQFEEDKKSSIELLKQLFNQTIG